MGLGQSLEVASTKWNGMEFESGRRRLRGDTLVPLACLLIRDTLPRQRTGPGPRLIFHAVLQMAANSLGVAESAITKVTLTHNFLVLSCSGVMKNRSSSMAAPENLCYV